MPVIQENCVPLDDIASNGAARSHHNDYMKETGFNAGLGLLSNSSGHFPYVALIKQYTERILVRNNLIFILVSRYLYIQIMHRTTKAVLVQRRRRVKLNSVHSSAVPPQP